MMSSMEVLKTYRFFRKKNQYPHLIGLITSTFMDVLERKGVITREKLFQQVLEHIAKEGIPDTEGNRQEYQEALIDYYSANYLS
ncbi:MAG: hypothetical protein NTY64_10930, partial [Deltaproteobacteria bacterium]|nr:hypothetical protein [Deltaproteobacteria bacterium]